MSHRPDHAPECALTETALFDALLPLHAQLGPDGRILHAGPGLVRLAGDRPLLGHDFCSVFLVTRPAGIGSASALLDAAPCILRLELATGRAVRLKGVLQPFAGSPGSLLSLSLALSDLPDLGGADLTARDFAPTDPTVDMLYLIEANAAAMAETRRLIARLDAAKAAAERQAFTDTLTGLGNRRALDRLLSRLLGGGRPFALLQLDLDRFKAVNDRHGHAVGDAVLVEVANRLRTAVRATDGLIRNGGDEFVVVSEGPTHRSGLAQLAARIIDGISAPMQAAGRAIDISVSVGAAVSTGTGRPSADRLLAHADAAAYAAKRAGRGLFRVHDGPAPDAQRPQDDAAA